MRTRTPSLAVVASALALVALTLPRAGAVGVVVNWPAYLNGPMHSSFNGNAATITPANAGTLHAAWAKVQKPDPGKPGAPAPSWLASPTVTGGRIYIGANTGDFYAYDLKTGTRAWKTFLGFQPTKTCPGEGIVATATAAIDHTTGKLMIYTAAGDGYLYALNSGTGTVAWRTQIAPVSATKNAFFPWSSPTVLNDTIYIGMASNCDNPLIQGGLKAFDQGSGHLLATYHAVPNGSVGGAIWSSAATNGSGSSIYVSIGNDDPNGTQSGDSFSIARLDPTTLARTDIWTVPRNELGVDSDFGGSPTIFRAVISGTSTSMVGACNKNGRYYALNAANLAAGPIWTDQIGDPHAPGGQSGLCLSAAIWDGARLFESGPQTTIRGTVYRGSVRELNPATGAYLWQTGLPVAVAGSPTLSGGGVIGVPTYDFQPGTNNAVYLLDASDGTVLGKVSSDPSQIFAQPVFAGKFLVVASRFAGLMAYTPA
jgi:outer membrane protein assembly factor BamB